MEKISVDIVEEDNICTIALPIEDATNLSKCIDIAKHFVHGNELYFGHFRTDGINLSPNEWIMYGKEIPKYFETNGRYEPLTTKEHERQKGVPQQGYLVIGSLPLTNEVFSMLPKVFHYYLETVFFSPKIEWGTFSESFRNYVKHGARDYVSNGFAEFLFSYADSGIFSISFDHTQYDQDAILQDVMRILHTA